MLIFDEFDSAALTSVEDLMQLKKIVKLFSSLIAFTGSDLQDFHQKFFENIFDLRLLRMNLNQISSPELLCDRVQVHSTVTEQRKSIETICLV